jgi:hypothetical protein
MTICASDPKSWKMCLVKTSPCSLPTSDSTHQEFCFEDVKVDNEILTGTVYNLPGHTNPAPLSGMCAPFDDRPNVSRMTFFFRGVKEGNPVEIVLSGLGFDGPNPIFVGGFVALQPNHNVQPRSQLEVNFDPGDTGTGTGMQAQCDVN